MKEGSRTAGAIAALLPALLALPPLMRSQAPAGLHNQNVPLFFMQPPEIPLGVSGHPFHATVTAGWNLPVPRGKKLATEVKGDVWRDAAGDVRVEGVKTRNGGAPVKFPTSNILFLADNTTMLSWNSESTNVMSLRPTRLEYSDHFFENLAVPQVYGSTRSYTLLNCRIVADTCVTEPIGERMIAGIKVNGTRYKETVPGRSVGVANDVIVSREVWTDPTSNVVVEINENDPVFGNFTMRLSGISQGDQNKDLFEVPKGYKVSDITPPSRLPAP